MLIQGTTGPSAPYRDGAYNTIALGMMGDLLVSELRGRYASAALRGKLFSVTTPAAVTAAAGTNTPITAAAAALLALYNPIGSGKNLLVNKASVITVSGTPAGPAWWNYAVNQNITATPNVTPRNALLQGAAASVAQGFSNTALTGAAAMTVLRPATRISAVAAGFNESPAFEDIGGDIVVPPGCVLALATAGTGTSHSLIASILYEELSIPM
jgi:hypothetical protein